MITLTLVAILGVLLVIVLMQLFNHPEEPGRRAPRRGRRRRIWPTSKSRTPVSGT